MQLSRMGQDQVRAEVAGFLDRARHASAQGDFAVASSLYASPTILIAADATTLLNDKDALHAHLEGLAAISTAATPPIWHQEVLDVQVINDVFAVVTAAVHRIDSRAKPQPPQHQSLTLRRDQEGFRFVAITNPIKSGYWKEHAPEGTEND